MHAWRRRIVPYCAWTAPSSGKSFVSVTQQNAHYAARASNHVLLKMCIRCPVELQTFPGKWPRPQHIRTVIGSEATKGKNISPISILHRITLHLAESLCEYLVMREPAIGFPSGIEIKRARGRENGSVEDFLSVTRKYSEKFLATLNAQEPEDLTDLSLP